MSDVHKDNNLKRIETAKKRSRLAHSAHEFFVNTEGGKELLKELAHQSGADLPSFSAKDDFNAYSAAFRDGMRANHLIISNLIKEHQENHEQRTKN